MSLETIIQELRTENERAHAIWGGPEHDDQHDQHDWTRYIMVYLGKLSKDNVPDEYYRECMLKIANLAVASIESLDRKNPEAKGIMYE